jgi:hypothetical protein
VLSESFLYAEEVSRVRADMFRPKLVGWAVEIARKVLDDSQVSARGTFRVITTREFLERQFS